MADAAEILGLQTLLERYPTPQALALSEHGLPELGLRLSAEIV
ncbi:hypothetical protein [Rhizobium laguerreae]|nr:hypothetical protein [Rhizobium laguerreae]